MSKLLTHVTTQAIIKNEKGEILLIRVAKPGKKYNYPGGHLEEGENWPEALEREVKEETGLTVTAGQVRRIFQIIWKDKPLLGIVAETEGVMDSRTAVVLSDEHESFAWFSNEQIKNSEEVDPYLKVDVEKAPKPADTIKT